MSFPGCCCFFVAKILEIFNCSTVYLKGRIFLFKNESFKIIYISVVLIDAHFQKYTRLSLPISVDSQRTVLPLDPHHHPAVFLSVEVVFSVLQTWITVFCICFLLCSELKYGTDILILGSSCVQSPPDVF